MADSGAAMIGAAVGTSTTTSYIESASGINEGGRTGLTAATVGILFILALFLSPLAGSIPAYATAPALFYVACLMVRSLTEVAVGRRDRSGARRRHGDHDALSPSRSPKASRSDSFRTSQSSSRPDAIAMCIRQSEFSLSSS